MSKPRSSRREFTKQVVALAVAPALAAVPAAAAPTGDTPPPPQRLATPGEALSEVARLRFGKHLSEEQLRLVRRKIESNLRMGEVLGRITLSNGDEPAFLFSADVP